MSLMDLYTRREKMPPPLHWLEDYVGLYDDDFYNSAPTHAETIQFRTAIEEQALDLELYYTTSFKDLFRELEGPYIHPCNANRMLNGKRLCNFGQELPGEEAECKLQILPYPACYTMMVNPQTGEPFKKENLEDSVETPKEPLELPEDMLEELEPKPYHPALDHNYWAAETCVGKMEKDEPKTEEEVVEEKVDMAVEEIFNSADEPVVDVWEIENFTEEQIKVEKPLLKQMASRISHPGFPYKNEARRSSRTAEKVRRAQARKISIAVHGHLKVNQKKARNARYNKNRRPKNSVETTPSQSDVDEWNIHPVRPTYTKLTKKKTSKGRVDHSESERHRREVLRTNFDCLSRLVPMKYMIGDKVSSQISKQKILVGAKMYILALRKGMRTARPLIRKKDILLEKCEKRISSKLLKLTRKQK